MDTAITHKNYFNFVMEDKRYIVAGHRENYILVLLCALSRKEEDIERLFPYFTIGKRVDS